MSDYVVLERLADGRLWIRLTEGVLAGRAVLAFPDPEPGSPLSSQWQVHSSLSPYRRSDRLLRSLLNEEQEKDWRDTRQFLVSGAYGMLQFGRISDIRFWPTTSSELRICVLPVGPHLPEPDVWTNLLFALKADPRRFFAVANWRRPTERQWHLGPVPGFATGD